MANNMADKNEHLVSMNGEYLYLSVNNARYAPLRVNTEIVNDVQNAILLEKPDKNSCLGEIASNLDNNKFVLTTHFNPTTKCTAKFHNPSTSTKNEMCFRQLCNGKCTDEFMINNVGKIFFPDKYKNTNQR